MKFIKTPTLINKNHYYRQLTSSRVYKLNKSKSSQPGERVRCRGRGIVGVGGYLCAGKTWWKCVNVCACVCLSECEGGRREVVIARIGLVGHFLLWLFPVEVNRASVQRHGETGRQTRRQTDRRTDRCKHTKVIGFKTKMWLAILVATHLLKNTWKMAYPKMMLNSLVISTFSKEWQP